MSDSMAGVYSPQEPWRDSAPQTDYEKLAGYVIDEIHRSGLKSPRRILRLVSYLYEATRLAAELEMALDEMYPPFLPRIVPRLEHDESQDVLG